MDVLSGILSVAQPQGFWSIIINAFENGVGSYLLAIVLITLIVRVILIPIDTINKKFNKKTMAKQAALKPELDKLQKRYANDQKLLNQKTQELYKKNGATVGGSCLIMLVYMVLNLTIFFTLFSSLNNFSAYKINQEYDILKYNYANVLNLGINEYEKGNTDLFTDYENVQFAIVQGEDEKTYIQALDKEGIEIAGARYEYKTDFSTPPTSEEAEDGITSDAEILAWIREYIEKEPEKAENPENPDAIEIPTIVYRGDEEVNGKKISVILQTMAQNQVVKTYQEEKGKQQFLWINNIWIADSPLKNSIFTFNEYKASVGAANVSEQEEVIYNAFMTPLRETEGRVNGYFILAIISIAISVLSMWLSQRGNQPVDPAQKKSSKITLIILPLIMGVFAIFYNSVFAIYLIAGQALTAIASPLQNLIIKKWEKWEDKRAEKKQAKTVVDYRRK